MRTDRKNSFHTQTQEQHTITPTHLSTLTNTPSRTILEIELLHEQYCRDNSTTNYIYNNTTEIIVPGSLRRAYTDHLQLHESNTRPTTNQRTIKNSTRHCDKKPPQQTIIEHHHHNKEPRHLQHKHSLQHASNHPTQASPSIVPLFRSEVIGVTTLNSSDILGTGAGIELRSGGVQRWTGCVVLG